MAAVRAELHAVNSGGFTVQRFPSRASAADAVRNRQVAAAYIGTSASSPELYVARAASSIRANYLETVFTQIAAATTASPPQLIDLVPLLPGDSGTAVFFYVFPVMMVAVITVLVLLQKAPTWSIERRMATVAAIGVLGASTAYVTAVNLKVLPNDLELLACAFCLNQVVGQMAVGLAPILKQYFLPVVMTWILVLSVPSAGATMVSDVIPTGLRYMSDVLPLAQAISIVRSVAYFGGAQTLGPWLEMLVWGILALMVLGVARSRMHRSAGVSASSATSIPSSELVTGAGTLR
ncbi:MAG TPA: hypothetical protein VHZ02_14125 [Acidimicrobiales bacterium]|nr:hypothetical protein [Acidimicrobiales bacterium]